MICWDLLDGSLLGLLGDFDPLDPNTDPAELLQAQDYLLDALQCTFDEAVDDFDDLQSGLWDLADLASQMPAVAAARWPLPLDGPWVSVKDGDCRARALFERHYSANMSRRRRTQARQFVGPGEKLVLLTPTCDALFVWRLERYRSDDSFGANCAVFRNEGRTLSSDLILAAETWAQRRWPFIPRFFTYVNPAEVQSANPGYCFRKAGWRRCGVSKQGLLRFEKLIVPLGCQSPWC